MSEEPVQANAALLARLANLYFAGIRSVEAQDAKTRARGDLPASHDYGLTENEIAAAQMMNGLLAENDAMLAALENAEYVMSVVEPRSDAGQYRAALAQIRAAIAMARNDR